MQSSLLALVDALKANPGLAAGFALVAAVGLQTVLALVGSIRRLVHQRGQFRLERERLNYLVKTAKTRWHTAEAEKLSWNGWRKFKVARKVFECEDVYSFYLEAHDGKPIAWFKPGQYLTFGLDIPGREKQVVRCYSLSDGPHRDKYYRVTIKRDAKPGCPPGVASSFFCDAVKEGDILNAKAPAGHFYVDLEKTSPVVLISAGVGITPVLSMAKAIVASGSQREVWFLFVCRNKGDYMLKADVDELAAKSANVRVQVCYSRPTAEDVKGRDYQHEGRLTADLLKGLLPSSNYDFYLCGNGAFMKDMYEGLSAWGVPEARIHFEAFGPATIKKTSDTVKLAQAKAAAESGLTVGSAAAVKCAVTFAKSGKQAQWDPKAGNLLEFARGLGVRIDSGCCAGSCGSCLVAIKSGAVDYLAKADAELEAGSCLTCICRPKDDLVLDA